MALPILLGFRYHANYAAANTPNPGQGVQILPVGEARTANQQRMRALIPTTNCICPEIANLIQNRTYRGTFTLGNHHGNAYINITNCAEQTFA